MRAVVLGGNGTSGAPVVSHLRAAGHNVFSASRQSDVDLITGAGMSDAFNGADVVVDCSNGPQGAPSVEFFSKGINNVIHHAKEQGVKHVVLLSIAALPTTVPGEIRPQHLSGKIKQEEALRSSGLDYTITRAAQFYDFIEIIAGITTTDGVCRLPDRPFQPVNVDEVGQEIAKLAVDAPKNGVVNVVGPQQMTLPQAARIVFKAKGIDTKVVEDDEAMMLGYIRVPGNQLLVPPEENPIIAKVTLEEWLRQKAA